MPGTHESSNKNNQGPTNTGGQRGGSTHDPKNTFGPERGPSSASTHPDANTKNQGSSGPGTNQHSK